MRPLVLVLFLSAAAAAGDRPGRAAHKPTPFESMLRKIEPSAKQCAELGAIARRAAAARARLDEVEREDLPAFRDALLRLRGEVAGDRGLDPGTMKAASSLKNRLKDAHTRYLKELSALEEAARGTLTVPQRARAGLRGKPAPEGGDLAELRREIAEVRAELVGEAGPLGRWLATPGAAEALAARAEGRAPPRLPRWDAGAAEALARETRELRRETNLWNLVNGLHLTEPQLLTIARAASRRSDGDACAKILATLSPEQHDVLFTYKACLVPPRNLRDPVRAGQADDTSAGEKLLAKLRSVPDARYAATEGRLLDATLRGIEAREGRFGEDDRIWMLLLLRRAARNARAMDDVEFQARANECADDLAPLYRLKSLKDDLRERIGRDAVLREMTRAFLLDPLMTRVCEDRLARLRAGVAVLPAGPIEVAPACPGEGECGRP